ncbi:MAG: hypothetical protein GX366_07290 [Epulopiscium sp.]|nr:hypothetical protein [Candidatus Epulonipiscium sp.]
MATDIQHVKEFILLLRPELGAMDNLDAYIAVTVRKILIYCNIVSLPPELVEIAGEMVVDVIEINKVNSTEGGTGTGEVKSIVEGDTTVTFDFSSNDNYRKELNRYFKDYKAHINPFRRLRW